MSKSEVLCPVCGDGYLHSHVEMEESTYKGHSELTPIHLSTCDTCGTIQTTAQQIRDNKRLFVAFKKKIDGLLSGSEIKAMRMSHNISQAHAAKLFGGGPVAFAKYEADDVMQSESMDKLIRIVLEIPQAKEWLHRYCNLPTSPVITAESNMPNVHIWERDIEGIINASLIKPFLTPYATQDSTEHFQRLIDSPSIAVWHQKVGFTAVEAQSRIAGCAHVILNKKYDIEEDENLNHPHFKSYNEQDYDRHTAKN